MLLYSNGQHTTSTKKSPIFSLLAFLNFLFSMLNRQSLQHIWQFAIDTAALADAREHLAQLNLDFDSGAWLCFRNGILPRLTNPQWWFRGVDSGPGKNHFGTAS
jgi:hypothetical protein